MACAKCGGSGWIIVEREGVSGAERCDCGPQQAAPQDLEAAANIPPLYRNASFDNFVLPQDNPIAYDQLSRALVKVKGYVRQFDPFRAKPGLMLTGPTGTGKTHLAVAALRALMARGFQGAFVDYQSLLQQIRSGYDEFADASEREAYSASLDVPVLLIDDLGAHRPSEWVEDTITGIITHRCNERRPLIVTTNLPDTYAGDAAVQRTPGVAQVEYRTTLADRIGERARSRLFEMCELVRLPAIGDYRLRAAR